MTKKELEAENKLLKSRLSAYEKNSCQIELMCRNLSPKTEEGLNLLMRELIKYLTK